MRERVAERYKAWGCERVLSEHNSVGSPNEEELAKLGVTVDSFDTTSTTKGQIVQSLAVCFERAEAKWLSDPVAFGEARAYESRVSAITGKVQYSAPDGMHDDTVIGRCLAWRVITAPRFGWS